MDRRPGTTTLYDGVASQPVADALRSAAGTMGRERCLAAADEAERLG